MSDDEQGFDVEAYIRDAPDRNPRFTEADLRLVSDRSYAQGRRDFALYLSRLADSIRTEPDPDPPRNYGENGRRAYRDAVRRLSAL